MNNHETKPSNSDESLRLTLINKMYELLTAAFSLVAALAWNDAIQTTFAKLFGSSSTLFAKYFYALLVTFIIVWLGIKLNKTSKALHKAFEKNKS